MQKLLREYMDELNRRRKKNRRTGIAVLVLVVIVFGSVMGVLTQYGVAMTGKPQCGLEEHTHTDECYEKTLVCGLEESEGHTHTDDCLYPAELTCGLEESESHTHTDECYTVPEGYACGLEESESHTHTDECYEETLVCGKEEHIHTDACYIDAESDEAAVNAEEAVAGADVEDAAAWDSQYTEVEWKGAWGEDLVTAAQIQIGYQESADNYTAAADGSQKGYTRFGHFAGDMYADWDAAFVNFCLHYAGIKESGYFPEETDTAKWREAFEQIREENAEYLTTPENYIPTAGDIVFFQKENEETDMQMGIVSAVNEHNRTIAVIEGNNGNEVKETEYSLDDAHIVNYLMLSSAENAYKNAGDAGEAIAETEENWAYEESFETENVVIHVKAKEGVVPEGAVLSVTPIEKTEITEDMPEEEAAKAEEINEQYELTNQKLLEESEKKEEVLQGFLAYDICFMVDGQETEPNGEVNVTMDFKEAVKPEGVSEDAAVTVTHLKEDESAEDGIVVEDLTEKEAATVTTAEENASVEKVELVAESFSTFVIQWIFSEWIFGEVSIEFVDENDKQIKVNDKSYQFDYGEKVNLEDVVNQITDVDGKRYSIQRFVAIDKTSWIENKYDIIAIERNGNGFTFYKNNQESRVYSIDDIGNVVVKAICSEIAAGIRIKDNIVEDGSLIVEGGSVFEEEAAKAGQTCRYVWYKRINDAVGKDGKPVYEEVEVLRYEGGLTNLSSDRTSLKVALDKGALNKEQTAVEYKVALQILDENGDVDADKTVESEPFSIQYYSDIRNGSFEDPAVNNFDKIADHAVEGWKTTSKEKSGRENTIEIVRVQDSGYIDVFYSKDAPVYYNPENGDQWFGSAADGEQFAELNCETVGTLYQDVLLMPGSPVNYYFSHRGRANSASNGKEKMYLVILPTKLAETKGDEVDGNRIIDTQSEVKKLIEYKTEYGEEAFQEEYPGAYISEPMQADSGFWQHYSGKYIPVTSLTRFFFVSAEEGTNTQGNFLDNIWFGQDLPVPSSDTFNLRVEKTVQGLGVETVEELKAELSGLNFEITVKDDQGNLVQEFEKSTLEASEMTWEPNSDGSYTGFYNYLEKDIQGTYTVSVTENGKDITDYNVEAESKATVSGQGVLSSASGNESVNIDVGAKQSVEVSFTNTYTKKEEPQPTVNWQMIKCSTSTDASETKLFLSGAEFKVSTAQNDKETVVATGTSGTDGVIEWKITGEKGDATESDWKPENGITYTITETKAPAGYSLMSGSLEVTFENGAPSFEKNDNVEQKENTDGDTTVTFYLKNAPVYSLPSTGGSGIFWYMFSGVLLMAGATLFLYKNKVQGGAGKLG